MKEIKVKLTFTESILGSATNNKELYREFIASKAPDAIRMEEEVEALGADAVEEKGTTVFLRDKDGTPMLLDHQIRGFFKEACGALRIISGTESKKLTSYKKKIDNNIFIKERRIPFEYDGKMGTLQRPLRAQTAQGERIAIASSEEINEGASVTFTVQCMDNDFDKFVYEWLNYGRFKGLGQWRNASHGRFTYEILSEEDVPLF